MILLIVSPVFLCLIDDVTVSLLKLLFMFAEILSHYLNSQYYCWNSLSQFLNWASDCWHFPVYSRKSPISLLKLPFSWLLCSKFWNSPCHPCKSWSHSCNSPSHCWNFLVCIYSAPTAELQNVAETVTATFKALTFCLLIKYFL